MEQWTILLMVLILLPFTECLSQEFSMTPEERYWFDLTGYLHIKGVLEGENLKKVANVTDRFLTTPDTDKPPGFKILEKQYFHAIGFDPCLDELPFHPRLWPIIREFTNDRPQMSGSGITVDTQGEGHLKLHCARESFGFDAARYEYHEGKIYCNDFVVFYYLTDVLPDDGGLVLVPGSHKSNFVRPSSMFCDGAPDEQIPEGVINITPTAGDVVIFSELLTHGVRTWQPTDRDRIMIHYRFKTQHRGYEHRFENELKALLPPELLELVQDGDLLQSKKIGKMNHVELS
tara:strand:- start:865 stop:1731 length:867 start_codon:yes stop_codon:yes gene_type:complete